MRMAPPRIEMAALKDFYWGKVAGQPADMDATARDPAFVNKQMAIWHLQPDRSPTGYADRVCREPPLMLLLKYRRVSVAGVYLGWQ